MNPNNIWWYRDRLFRLTAEFCVSKKYVETVEKQFQKKKDQTNFTWSTISCDEAIATAAIVIKHVAAKLQMTDCVASQFAFLLLWVLCSIAFGFVRSIMNFQIHVYRVTLLFKLFKSLAPSPLSCSNWQKFSLRKVPAQVNNCKATLIDREILTFLPRKSFFQMEIFYLL